MKTTLDKLSEKDNDSLIKILDKATPEMKATKSGVKYIKIP